MNNEGRPREYVEALETITRWTKEDHPLRKEALKLVREAEHGGDVTKHMRAVKFQCLDCLQSFETEKQCRVHVGMYNGSCDPRDKTPRIRVEDVDKHINELTPGP